MNYIKSRKHALTTSTPSPLSGVSSTTLTLAAALGVTQAWAQSPDAPAPALPTVRVEAGPDFKAEESSSRKFTAPLIDTPRTVTVIPQEVIRQTNATTLSDALRTTPGITFGAGEGGSPMGDRPFLRGFDTQSSTFVDGLRDIAPSTREVFNLESIEVIKGPDSATGGRGGAGGSVQLYTKTPKKENFFNGSVGLGIDSYKRATIDLNRMLSDTIAVRLNAMSFDADVPGRNGPSNSRWGIAPSISFGLGTPTRVTLSYFRMRSDDVPDGGVPFYVPTTLPAYGVVKLRPSYGNNRENWYGVHGRDFRQDAADAFTAQVEHDISSTMKFRNVTRITRSKMDYIWTQPDDSQGNTGRGYVWRRFNGSMREIDTMANLSEISGSVTTGSIKHSYAAGVELSREKASNDSYTQLNSAYSANQKCPKGAGAASSFTCTSLYFPTPNDPWTGMFVPNSNPTNFHSDTVSLYAFDTIEFSPQWLLNAGLRLDHYKARQDSAFPTTTRSGGLSLPRLTGEGRTTLEVTDTLVNYQLGVVYKPAPNGSVYASIGTSSTPPGNTLGQGQETQTVTAATLDLKPEKNRSIELGTKWDLLDKQLSVTGALFQIETTNARVTNPTDGSVSMAGDKLVRGLELGVSGNVTKQLQVFGGYTLLDSEGRNLGLVNVAATGRPAIYLPNAGTGQPFQNTPKHSLSLWASYKPTPAWTLGLGAFYQSEVFAGYAYAAGTNGNTVLKRNVPGYTRVDAMVGYAVNKNLNLQLNVQNLTDKVYYNSATSPHYANMAPGRQVTLTANVSF